MVDAKGVFGRYPSYLPSRFQKFIWQVTDLVMPIGFPLFLTCVILVLLIVDSIVALSRW
jgi:hypothetical protein